MNRRSFLGAAGLSVVVPSAVWSALKRRGTPESGEKIDRLHTAMDEWRRLLDDGAYRVLFEGDTERPFSSPLVREKRRGTYVCAACFLPLFDSKTKFESGTGWPSFYQPVPGRVETKRDFKLIIPRTEYHCIRCGGHQGHVFEDGPPPTGERWCNNGLALRFVPEEEALPPLRNGNLERID